MPSSEHLPQCILVTILLAGVTCFAQLSEADTLRIQFRLNSGFFYQNGNVHMFSQRSRLDFVARTLNGKIAFTSQNSHLYQSFYKQKSDNDLFSRNYLYYRPKCKIYPYLISYISSSYRRKINFRGFYGGGVSIRLLNTPRNQLKISVNTIYEQTHYALSQFNLPRFNGDASMKMIRSTLYLSGLHAINNHLKIYYSTWYIRSVEKQFLGAKTPYRWEIDGGIEYNLSERLKLNFTALVTREGLFPVNVKPYDAVFVVGLTTKWNKP